MAQTALRQLERQLTEFFTGKPKPRQPEMIWGFRYGPDSVPSADAPIYGPFASRAEAQAAAEAAPYRKADRAYGWAAERIPEGETPLDPAALTRA
jgi:hypothetical protein